MKTLLSVGKLVTRLPLEKQFSLAKECGFDGVDYILEFKDLWILPECILALSKKYNMPVYGLHIPLPLVLFTPNFLNKRLFDRLEYFPLCEVFNVHLSCFLNPFSRGNKKLLRFTALAKVKKVNISFESNPTSYRILNLYPVQTYKPDIFAKFCITNKLPINLDISHISSADCDIIAFFIKYFPHINLIHLSDFNGKTQHLPFGYGKLPLADFFKILKKYKYKGRIIFEIYNYPKGSSIAQRNKDLKKSLNLFKKFAF